MDQLYVDRNILSVFICEPGLGICSFTLLLFALCHFAQNRSNYWATVSDSLSSLFKTEPRWGNRSRHLKKEQRWGNRSRHLKKEQRWANRSRHLKKEWHEWFALDLSELLSLLFPFLMPKSESLKQSDPEQFYPVAHDKRAMRAICSFSRANHSFAHKKTSNFLKKPMSKFPTLAQTYMQ